jgi:hypothetical protein
VNVFARERERGGSEEFTSEWMHVGERKREGVREPVESREYAK